MEQKFYDEIKNILITARNKVYQTANFAMVEAYWNIGKSIIEEQGGNEKAEYGTGLLKELSKQMTQDFGKGFTVANLKNMRQFYLTFPNGYALRSELSWTHYRLLMFNAKFSSADEVYESIYKQAKSSIYVVDNYIGLRTLVHLKNSPAGVAIILFSDNVGNNKLHNIEFIDFCKEYPTVNLSMKKTGGIFHDRFIVLDYGTADERVFLCGASSKDAGARITSIVEDYGISKYAPVIATLLKNPTLILPH